jgi:hypothetical protein
MPMADVYDIAEEACQKALAREHQTLDAGMKRLGTRTFMRMVLDVEAAIEKHLRMEEFER